MNNATLLTADLATHLKIIAIALAAAAIAVLVGIGAQTGAERSEPLTRTTGQAAAPGN
jgi:ABC-type proline/glycine betaine transport system permease subunit